MKTKNEKLELDENDKRIEEWQEIERLVLSFQRQFIEGVSEEVATQAKDDGRILVSRFAPIVKKYLNVICSCNIDYDDKEMKEFVALFIDDYELKKALYRKKVNKAHRYEISTKFNFVTGTYGTNTIEDIVADLNMCLLILAKRYKNVGKNFCAYVYNVYKHEVARHIKRTIKNPLAVSYKNCRYEDCINGNEDTQLEIAYEDNYYENITGLPDLTWMAGQSCSEYFEALTPFQRKILVKYYLEDWNDRQIAENLGAHINTINQKRRDAIDILCEKLCIDKKDIKRSRKSGLKASLPVNTIN